MAGRKNLLMPNHIHIKYQNNKAFMKEEIKFKTWTDSIDQLKYAQTGITLLFRKPQPKPSPENFKFELSLFC